MFHRSFKTKSHGRISRAAVIAMMALGPAVALSSLGIVRAERMTPAAKSKTFSCSSGTACVEGKSTGNAYGVYGTSSGVHGIYGQTTTASGGYAGVYGIATANGYGVYGASSDRSGNYAGLSSYGANSSTNLLLAYNNATKGKCLMDPNADLTCTGSIIGANPNTGAAVKGNSTGDGGTGVYGTANNGYGVWGNSGDTSGDYSALVATGNASETWLLVAENLANSAECAINAFADFGCTGTIDGSDVRMRQQTSTGQRVLAYAPKATSPTMRPRSCRLGRPPGSRVSAPTANPFPSSRR